MNPWIKAITGIFASIVVIGIVLISGAIYMLRSSLPVYSMEL